MPFSISVNEVAERVHKSLQQQEAIDDKLYEKYKKKVDKHLVRMSTPEIRILFREANWTLLRRLVHELIDEQFGARIHSIDNDAAILYISLHFDV